MSVIFQALRSVANLSRERSCFWSRNLATLSKSTKANKILEAKENEILVEIPEPLDHEDFFGVRKLVKMEELFNARVHYGHTMGTLNEHMKQFVLGERLGTLIFDLDQTAELLKDALNFIAHIAFRGGIIMFIARYKQNSLLIENTALECGEYCHTRDFSRGTFTDDKKFGMMTRLPDLTIFLNTQNTVFDIHQGVMEASKLLIPSVGIVDTNCFPNYITYPVPGNDDTPEACELYCRLFKEAILRGKAKRNEFIEMYQASVKE